MLKQQYIRMKETNHLVSTAFIKSRQIGLINSSSKIQCLNCLFFIILFLNMKICYKLSCTNVVIYLLPLCLYYRATNIVIIFILAVNIII